jgi:nitroreductase
MSLETRDIEAVDAVLKNIYSRRSVRKYLQKDVPDELIKEIIKAGTFAPSAVNKQPWRFVIIKNKDAIERYGERAKELWANKSLDNEDIVQLKKTMAQPGFKVFYDAPTLVLIFAHPDAFSPEIDCALAAENMMLAARSLGIGSCWVGLARVLGSDQTFLKELDIPEGYDLIAPLTFGYPKTTGQKAPPRKADVIHKWVC